MIRFQTLSSPRWTLLSSAFLVWVFQVSVFANPPEVGQPAPELSYRGAFNTAHEISLKNLRGKVVLLFFSQARCPSCSDWYSELLALQKEYTDRGLIVIQVMDAPSREVLGYLEKGVTDFIIVSHAEQSHFIYDTKSSPMIAVISPTGKTLFWDSPALLWRRVKDLVKTLTLEVSPENFKNNYLEMGMGFGDAKGYAPIEYSRPNSAAQMTASRFKAFEEKLNRQSKILDKDLNESTPFYWLNLPQSNWAVGNPIMRRASAISLSRRFKDDQDKLHETGKSAILSELSRRVQAADPDPEVRIANLRAFRYAYRGENDETRNQVLKEIAGPVLKNETAPLVHLYLLETIFGLKNPSVPDIPKSKYLDLGSDHEYPFSSLALHGYPWSVLRSHYEAYKKTPSDYRYAKVEAFKSQWKGILGGKNEWLSGGYSSVLFEREILQRLFKALHAFDGSIEDQYLCRCVVIKAFADILRYLNVSSDAEKAILDEVISLLSEKSNIDDWIYYRDLLYLFKFFHSGVIGQLNPEEKAELTDRLRNNPLLVGQGKAIRLHVEDLLSDK